MSTYLLKAEATSDTIFEFQVTTCFALLGLVLSVALMSASPGVAAALTLIPG